MNPESNWELIGKLLNCASKGDKIGLNKLLMEGVSPNVKDYDDRTALHLAASEGHASIVELLLEYKACVNPYDRWKRTPLADSIRYEHKDICMILEANGGTFDGDTIQNEVNSNDYDFDHDEIDSECKSPIDQTSDSISEKVKWRGTLVAQITITDTHVVDSDAQNIFKGLRKLRHPNIVQFLGAVIKNDKIIILTEYLPKGTLLQLLKKKNQLDWQTALKFSLDIARGMNYLHEQKQKPLVHNYLSTSNLFQEAKHLKIGYIWLQKLLTASPTSIDDKDGRKSTCCQSYDTKVDVQSFAHIFYEMLEGLHSIYQGELKIKAKKCPKSLRDLIYECDDREPSKRPTFREIIKRLEKIEKLYSKDDCLIC